MIAVIAALIFAACGKTETAPASDFGETAVSLPAQWETDKGIYFTATSWFLAGITPGLDLGPGDYDDFIGDPLLLYMNDAITGNTIVLCNRPDCRHGGADCNACLPEDEYYDTDRHDIRSTTAVFADGPYLYAHNGGSLIFRFNLDGTGRTEAVTIPSQYQGLKGWLMNGKLYAQANAFSTTGDFELVNILTKVLLEIDYISGEVRELWRENREQGVRLSEIFAVSEGKLYGIEKKYPYKFPLDFASDDMKRDFYHDTEYTLFFVDPGDDEARTNIIRSSKGAEFNPCLKIYFSGDEPSESMSPGLYYHSSWDEAVYLLDLSTGEASKIIANIPGTMQITGLFGGRLFMVDYLKDNEAGHRVFVDFNTGLTSSDNTAKMHETLFFADPATGKMEKSAIITKRTLFDAITLAAGGYSGNTDAFANIIFEEDGYFYLEIERQEKEADIWGNGSSIHIHLYRHLIGKIPLADYWAGNADAIEEVGWVDADAFLAMRR